MIKIDNQDIFGKVIADALAAVELNKQLSTWEKLRWTNAIAKAAAQIEDNGTFMDWQEEKQTLLIWSDKSNNIYEANGVCQCKAFEMNQPCWHRTAKKLYINYLSEIAAAEKSPVDITKAPYLPRESNYKPTIIAGVRV